MTADDITENVLAVLYALNFQKLVNAANEVDPELYELINAAVMSAQIADDQGLTGLVWMASANHRVH